MVDYYCLLVDLYYLYVNILNMKTDVIEKPTSRHVGKNLQRVRIYFGVKQEALAADLGVSQQTISKIEQQQVIEHDMLKKIGEVLGVSADIIENFDEEGAIYNINNNSFRDNTFEEGSTAIAQQFNPIEKIVELYERLLQSEREKIDVLLNNKS